MGVVDPVVAVESVESVAPPLATMADACRLFAEAYELLERTRRATALPWDLRASRMAEVGALSGLAQAAATIASTSAVVQNLILATPIADMVSESCAGMVASADEMRAALALTGAGELPLDGTAVGVRAGTTPAAAAAGKGAA